LRFPFGEIACGIRHLDACCPPSRFVGFKAGNDVAFGSNKTLNLETANLNGNRESVLLEMSAEQPIELEGIIKTVLPGTMFKVTLDNQHEVLAHISGKMRKHFVRLTVGDRVRMEMSPYDLTKARITYRMR
jgi:translation initiation factor IF-1